MKLITTQPFTHQPPAWLNESLAGLQTFEGRVLFGEVCLNRIPYEMPMPSPTVITSSGMTSAEALCEPTLEELQEIEDLQWDLDEDWESLTFDEQRQAMLLNDFGPDPEPDWETEQDYREWQRFIATFE